MEKKKQNKNKASPNYIFIAKKARYLLYFELRAYSVTYLLTYTTALNSRLKAVTKWVKNHGTMLDSVVFLFDAISLVVKVGTGAEAT